jgi:hypothetical protein
MLRSYDHLQVEIYTSEINMTDMHAEASDHDNASSGVIKGGAGGSFFIS